MNSWRGGMIFLLERVSEEVDLNTHRMRPKTTIGSLTSSRGDDKSNFAISLDSYLESKT